MHNIIENPCLSPLSPEKMFIARAFNEALRRLSQLEHTTETPEVMESLKQQRSLARGLAFQLAHTARIEGERGKEQVVFFPDPDGAEEARTIVESTLFRAGI